MAELLPCPFCGGEPEEFVERDSRTEPLVHGHPLDVFVDNEYFGVRCRKCDVGHTNPFIERDDAIAAWNTRASPQSRSDKEGEDSVECSTCEGSGKIVEPARTEGINQHSACQRDCEDCGGTGRTPNPQQEGR